MGAQKETNINSMLDFDKLVEQQFKTTTMQEKSHQKFVEQYNSASKFKFTPSKGTVAPSQLGNPGHEH